MLEKPVTTEHNWKPCSFWRRLGAMLYDTMLLICVIFIAWQPVPLLPDFLHPLLGRALRLGYLVAICFIFFGWFWTHGGQTLGMRAWRVKIIPQVNSGVGPVTWKMAWLRFISSLFSWSMAGLGFLWSLFHHDKLAWHDIFSRTRLIITPRE